MSLELSSFLQCGRLMSVSVSCRCFLLLLSRRLEAAPIALQRLPVDFLNSPAAEIGGEFEFQVTFHGFRQVVHETPDVWIDGCCLGSPTRTPPVADGFRRGTGIKMAAAAEEASNEGQKNQIERNEDGGEQQSDELKSNSKIKI
jgi:hypothetical protein